MYIEDAYELLIKAKLYELSLPNYQEAYRIAVRSMKALVDISNDISTMIEADKRSWSNRETDKDLYFDGILDVKKLIDRKFYYALTGEEQIIK